MKLLFKLSLIVLFTMGISNISNAGSWTSWVQMSCHKGIDFRVNPTHTSLGEYDTYLEFRNRYYQPASFTFEITGGVNTSRNNRITVPASSTHKTWAGVFPSNHWRVSIDKVRLGPDGLQPYKGCD